MRGWGSVLIALGVTALIWVVSVVYALWWIVPVAVTVIAAAVVCVFLVRSALTLVRAARARRVVVDKEPTLADAVRAEVESALTALDAIPGAKRALEQGGWFFVLGAMGSGRSTLLRELGLGSSLEGRDGVSVAMRGSPACQWWTGPPGVFVEVHPELASQPEAFAALLDELARRGWASRAQGVLVTCAVDQDFERIAQRDLRERAERSRAQIEAIADRLGVDPVVSVLVTKCDRLLGFVETFGALPPAAEARPRWGPRDQVWGTTFRTAPSVEHDKQVLSARLDEVVDALERFTFERLGQLSDLQDRALVFQFPDQVRAAAKSVSELCEVLFPERSRRRARGVYLTSATRSGSAKSLLEDEAFGVVWATPARSEEQSTFLRGLLDEVLVPDAAQAAPSQDWLRKRERLQHAGIVAIGAALALVSATLVWAYAWHARVIDRGERALSTAAVPSLDELLRVRHELDDAPFVLGWRRADVRDAVADLHARRLLAGVFAQVHQDHARELAAFANGTSQDYARTYERFRAYLRLSREIDLDAMPADQRVYERRWLAGHLALAWRERAVMAPASARLPWYGAHALAFVEWLDGDPQALPADPRVVSQVRARARALDRTGESMDWLSRLDARSRSVDDLLGGRRVHLRGAASVPRAFTHDGLSEEVYPWLATTALSLDEPWVLEGAAWSEGASHEVRERVWTAYFHRYEDEWDKLLSAVHVDVPRDREASDRMLGGVAREIAPLIGAVRRETMGLDASPESWGSRLVEWSLTRIGERLDGTSLPPDPVRDTAARQLQENFAPLFEFGSQETISTYESYLSGASERDDLEARRTQVVQFVQRLDVGRWRLPLERLLVSPIDAALRRF